MSDLRSRFSKVLARDEVYLANHSLGRPLDRVSDDVQEALDAWMLTMDEAWSVWLAEFDRFERNVKSLIHWPEEGAVVHKSSVGQGLRAVLNALPSPARVVTTTSEFDSVEFILREYEKRGLVQVQMVEPSRIEQGIAKFSAEDYCKLIVPGTDLVILSLVIFTTGQIIPHAVEIIRHAHQVGARVFLDTYHAAGVYDLDYPEADFMAGGCYKYLRGGPGACWLAIHPRNLGLETLDTGWFAKENTFGYDRQGKRAKGGRGWWESTPSPLPVFQARSGLEFTLEIGADEIRRQTLTHQRAIREGLAPFGGFVPESELEWGATCLLPTQNANEVVSQLKKQKVNVDARQGLVRFGPDILTTEEDIERAVRAVAQLESLVR